MQFSKGKMQRKDKIITALCRFLYIVGIQSIRVLKRVKRRSRRFFRPVWNLCKVVYTKTLGKWIARVQNNFLSLWESFQQESQRLSELVGPNRPTGAKARVKAVGKYVSVHKRLVLSILNIAAPVAAIAFLFGTAGYWVNLNYGLVLTYEGEEIATIQDEGVFEKAAEMMNQRMVYDTATTTDISVTPTFTLAITDSARYAAPSTLCDTLIQKSNGIIEEGSGLYVNGDLIGAVKSSADMTFILQNLLNIARGSDRDAKVSFTDNVETITGLFPTASIVTAEKMNEKLTGTTEEAVTYTVQEGDTATSIAEKFQLSLEELNQLNGGQVGDSLQIGASLNVKTAESFLKVKVVKEETYQAALPYNTITIKDDGQYTDYTKVTVEGKNGLQECVDEVTYIDGIEVSRTSVSKKTLTEPVDREVVTGTKKRPAEGYATGNMMWPVPSIHHITSYFAWRWGSMHTGLDISGGNSYGKTIVAADGGTVSYVRYSNVGYGNHLEINHGNGLRTLYGHTSKILVTSGQKVAKGQPIALIGSTGNSTGAHLHFEVISNGTKVNPLNYVSN